LFTLFILGHRLTAVEGLLLEMRLKMVWLGWRMGTR